MLPEIKVHPVMLLIIKVHLAILVTIKVLPVMLVLQLVMQALQEMKALEIKVIQVEVKVLELHLGNKLVTNGIQSTHKVRVLEWDPLA